jgi:hypothetical protein
MKLVAAESQTNLRGTVRLFDDIVEVEEPSTHDVEFRIDQFKHFTHDSLRRVACEQHLAQSKPAPHSCSMLEDDFRSVREITVTIAVSFRYARAKFLGQKDLRLGMSANGTVWPCSKGAALFQDGAGHCRPLPAARR